jgi:hypothetical protein
MREGKRSWLDGYRSNERREEWKITVAFSSPEEQTAVASLSHSTA